MWQKITSRKALLWMLLFCVGMTFICAMGMLTLPHSIAQYFEIVHKIFGGLTFFFIAVHLAQRGRVLFPRKQ